MLVELFCHVYVGIYTCGYVYEDCLKMLIVKYCYCGENCLDNCILMDLPFAVGSKIINKASYTI